MDTINKSKVNNTDTTKYNLKTSNLKSKKKTKNNKETKEKEYEDFVKFQLPWMM